MPAARRLRSLPGGYRASTAATTAGAASSTPPPPPPAGMDPLAAPLRPPQPLATLLPHHPDERRTCSWRETGGV
eukprot:9248022-Pyramimonas_sp.AAC.1